MSNYEKAKREIQDILSAKEQERIAESAKLKAQQMQKIEKEKEKIKYENYFQTLKPHIPNLLSEVNRSVLNRSGKVSSWHVKSVGGHVHSDSDGETAGSSHNHSSRTVECSLRIPKTGLITVFRVLKDVYPDNEHFIEYKNSSKKIFVASQRDNVKGVTNTRSCSDVYDRELIITDDLNSNLESLKSVVLERLVNLFK